MMYRTLGTATGALQAGKGMKGTGWEVAARRRINQPVDKDQEEAKD